MLLLLLESRPIFGDKNENFVVVGLLFGELKSCLVVEIPEPLELGGAVEFDGVTRVTLSAVTL